MEIKTFEATTHTDIYGNLKHYLVLGKHDKTIILKISEKDYDKINELDQYNPNQEELPFGI